MEITFGPMPQQVGYIPGRRLTVVQALTCPGPVAVTLWARPPAWWAMVAESIRDGNYTPGKGGRRRTGQRRGNHRKFAWNQLRRWRAAVTHAFELVADTAKSSGYVSPTPNGGLTMRVYAVGQGGLAPTMSATQALLIRLGAGAWHTPQARDKWVLEWLATPYEWISEPGSDRSTGTLAESPQMQAILKRMMFAWATMGATYVQTGKGWPA